MEEEMLMTEKVEEQERRDQQYLTVTAHRIELRVQSYLSPGNTPGFLKKIMLEGDPWGNGHSVERAELWFRDDTPNAVPSYNEKTKTIIASYPSAEYNSYVELLADKNNSCRLKYYKRSDNKLVQVDLETV